MTNEQIVQLMVSKGIITTDAISASGKLQPKQANKFIDYVVDVTGINQMCRVVRFRNEQLHIDKIGVGRRVTVPAEEARDPGVRRGVTTSQVVLQPVELMTPFELSTNFMEHNIEGESVEDHVVRMMATQMGNDVEELGIIGDILGPAALESDLIDGGSTSHYIKDSFLGKLNGWLRQADAGHGFDAQGASISANIFSELFLSLPYKFRRNRSRLRFITSPDLEQMFRERLSTRTGGLGDAALTSTGQMTIFGIPIVSAGLMQKNPTTVEHITFTGAGSSVSLRYNNLVDGSVVVTPSTLGKAPEAPYVVDTDYSVNYTTGVITHIAAAGIGNTATVKVTYQASPQVLLTHQDNMIFAIGRDISVERDRDIFARLNQWAISTKVDYKFEETDAVAKAYNISNSL